MTPHHHKSAPTSHSEEIQPPLSAETPANAVAIHGNLAPGATEDLRARCAALENELAKQRDETLRGLAEFENARKRLLRETEDARSYANEKILQDLFPVLDSMEMTLSHADEEQHHDPVIAGVELALKQFKSILAKHGLDEVGIVGEIFDPHWHEAISTLPPPDGVALESIVQVHRKGYKLRGRLIRAAMVTVAQ